MDAIFPISAFVLTLVASRRSLGLALVVVFGVGYLHGVIRANFLGVATTFMFDSGLLGFYLGTCLFHANRFAGIWSEPATRFLAFLIAWPAVMAMVPVNDLLVQLVALRGTVWFLPVLLIATRFRASDLTVLARNLAGLNLMALAGGIYVYQNGIESLYPQNAVTQIIYISKDVSGHEYYRVPSTFLSAHAYGGTMLFSLPFLLGQLFGPRVASWDRALATIGVVAAGVGILLCAARSPAVMIVLATAVVLVQSRFSPRVALVGAGLAIALVVVALSDERLQRVTTLEDTDYISTRVEDSTNVSLLELIASHPFGAGMGSSVGTSIPYFLADRAPKQIGLENEFSRILVDQGWIGLAGWIAYLFWLFRVPPPFRPAARWGVGVASMYGLCLVIWATALTGAGTLSSVPQSVLMLAQMGVISRLRQSASKPNDETA
jgi:hypothetical protein